MPSFKIFMFYGSHGLHGASADQSAFLMIPDDESYDFAHFEFVMRGIQGPVRDPRFADRDISLSLHCETAEIMRAYTKLVEQEGKLTGLEAYSASRRRTRRVWRSPSPPTSPTRPICQHQPAAPVSRKAIEAAMMMRSLPAHRLPPRGHGRALARRLQHRQPRRQGEPAPALAGGRRGAVGAPAGRGLRVGGRTTPAARTRRSSVSLATTSSWRSPASAAPSTCCPAWSPRGASGGFRTTASPTGVEEPGRAFRPGRQGRPRRRLRRRLRL